MAGRKSDFTLTKLDDLFTTQAQRDEEQLSKIRDIPLELIDDFPDHPFKVRDDEDISEETRMNIGKMFDFKRDCIIPEGMHGGWQTSGTVKVCHLAFNLWNGFTEEGRETLCTPEELFCCGYAPYFMEGIKLRYPEYCRDLTPPKRNDMER